MFSYLEDVYMTQKKKLENLLLLSCRSPFADDDRVYPALGNLYLKSFINKYRPNVNVTIDDDYDLSNPETFEPFDIIGISIMTPQREEALKILHTIKNNYKDKIVIAGGPHIKHYLQDIIDAKEPYDYFVPLDGEKAILEIIDGKSNRINNSIMSKLDIYNQPRPDRTSDQAKKMLSKYYYNLGGKKSSTMMTARGCPEKCKFCEEAQTAVKWSALENLKMEMDDIKNLGYQGVYIFDDLFALAKVKVEPICKELKKRDLIYRCNGQARYFTQDESFAEMLADTGCYEIAFGAESGSQKILDAVEKRTTVEQNYKFVELCLKNNIICKAFLMIGLPGETQETIAQTEKFIRESGIKDFQLSIYYPYKGTKIRDAIDRGETGFDLFLEDDKGLGAYGTKGGKSEGVLRTSTLSKDDLVRERDRIVDMYRPYSHGNLLSENIEDHFFDTNQKTKVEYKGLLNLTNGSNDRGNNGHDPSYKTENINRNNS